MTEAAVKRVMSAKTSKGLGIQYIATAGSTMKEPNMLSLEH